MDWIEHGLAIGAIEDALCHSALQAAGVRSIITLNGFPDQRHTPFLWREVLLRDGAGNSNEQIQRAVTLLAALHRSDPAVLIHCAEGKSRAALVVTLYLATRDRLSFDAAYTRVRAVRPAVWIDDALRRDGEALLWSLSEGAA